MDKLVTFREYCIVSKNELFPFLLFFTDNILMKDPVHNFEYSHCLHISICFNAKENLISIVYKEILKILHMLGGMKRDRECKKNIWYLGVFCDVKI